MTGAVTEPTAVGDPDGYVTFTCRGLDWTVEARFVESVRAVAEQIDSLDDLAGASLVKRNMVRAVYRLPFDLGAGEGAVAVKRYNVRGPRDWVKYLFKPSRALAEWQRGRGLAAAGIPTAVPLAMAERRSGVLLDAALVTRWIPGTVHLNAFIREHYGDGPQAAGARRRLYLDLAHTIRRLHDAGFVHRDLHGGNVLVSGTAGEPALHLIDLHSTGRPRGGVSPRARWNDLTKLLHSQLTCTTGGERLALLRDYAALPGLDSALAARLACPSVAGELEETLARMELKRVRSRTARALTRSSRFEYGRAAGMKIHHLRDIPRDALLPLFPAHAETLRRGGRGVLKNSVKSALTRQVLELPSGPRSVIVKEYRTDGLLARLKNTVRRPRAVAAWLAGNGLRVRRFDVAEPLALALRGRGPMLGRAFVVMEDLGDETRLDLVALRRFAGTLDDGGRRRKRELVLLVARVVRALHAGGVYHADLKAVNLFVRDAAAGDGPSLALADYDRVEFDRQVVERRRIKNLAQLSAGVAVCIGLTDRLRFFREYARQDPAALGAWKRWFRDVMHLCERKIVVRMNPIE